MKEERECDYQVSDRTLSHFFIIGNFNFFLKLCNFFNVPLYIQVTGEVENKGGKCFHENNFKANDCFFSFLAMIISVACSTAVAAETLEDQNVTSHRVVISTKKMVQ